MTRGPGVAERVSVGSSWWAGWVAGEVGSRWQRGRRALWARGERAEAGRGVGRAELGQAGGGGPSAEGEPWDQAGPAGRGAGVASWAGRV